MNLVRKRRPELVKFCDARGCVWDARNRARSLRAVQREQALAMWPRV